jgi:ABC-type phosphate transport system substrate-binding protein
MALLALAPMAAAAQVGPQPVVIAHPSVGALNASTLQRLYTGRAIEVDGRPVTVVNAPAGSPLRARFLESVLEMDDQKYIAYWIVRRHIGKGAPPPELKTAAEVIEFVRQTPGGIGYIAASDLRPGLNVVFRP